MYKTFYGNLLTIKKKTTTYKRFRIVVFNTTSNNISVIS